MAAADWQEEVQTLRGALFRSPRDGPAAHLLFLCVANSARSQVAEGIARSLAPEGVRVSSAGAWPASVHRGAVEVLEEIGIDASQQFSKSIDEIDLATVDAVITLCGEQVCPIMPGGVPRVHWPMPDPTGRGLAGFRELCAELQRRLGALLVP
ncbi:MAG: arsenate reductase ArsC [Deltaproteobacteria bacterium]|nr:arsenate reductase ArsC [Deltaproteobacteria bacterium]